MYYTYLIMTKYKLLLICLFLLIWCNDLNWTCSDVAFRWEHSWGGPIPETGRINAADGILSISNSQADDSGNYTCVVSNMAGEKHKNIWVVVSGKNREIEKDK